MRHVIRGERIDLIPELLEIVLLVIVATTEGIIVDLDISFRSKYMRTSFILGLFFGEGNEIFSYLRNSICIEVYIILHTPIKN